MKNSPGVLLLLLFCIAATAQEDSVVTKELISLKYYSEKNSLQYLLLDYKLKTGKQTEPMKNKTFYLYLDSIGAANRIAAITTGADGRAKSFLPVGLKEKWDASSGHKFLAVAAGKEDEVAAELEIVKARISIDTVIDGETKNMIVQVSKYENDEWAGAADVEVKAGIQRLGGMLPAGDEETYTTDSAGTITVVLNKDSLPGDNKGNIVLVAKIEDNDLYGNLLIEKTVPWGVATTPDKNFFEQRKLWSTKFKTPLWLLLMAYSIVIGVWGTIIYLILQIIRIKKIRTISS